MEHSQESKQQATTKEILQERMSGRKRTPLYSSTALDSILKIQQEWLNTKVRQEDRDNWLKTPYTVLGSEIPREMLYNPLSNKEMDYLEDLGNSGEWLRIHGASMPTCTADASSRCAS